MSISFNMKRGAAIFLLIAALIFLVILLGQKEATVSLRSSIADTLAISNFIQTQKVTETELRVLAENVGKMQRQLSQIILDTVTDLNNKTRGVLNMLPEADALGKRMMTLNNENQNTVIELMKVKYSDVFNKLDIVGNRAIYLARKHQEFNAAYNKLNTALSGTITETKRKGD